jgi:hypothetical protein
MEVVMHLRPKLVQPRLGAWLVGLFAEGEECEQMVGDLQEEYHERSARAGRAAARRWYRRQIFRSLPHLVGAAFGRSRWTTALVVVIGFELRKQVMAHLPERVIFALVDRFDLAANHFAVYRFLASTGIDIGHLITFLLIGLAVGLIARRREMAPALVLGLIYAVMAVVASVWFVSRSHEFEYLLRLCWYFSDALAIVMGAAIVRTLRMGRAHLAVQA